MRQPQQTTKHIMDINDIEKNYARMSDRELINIATTRGEGLKPGVIEIIEKEIAKRNLNPDLLAGIIAQNKTYTSEEIEQYAQLLSNLPCPVCDSNQQKLNGTVAHTVKSFLIFTTSERKPTIACPDCLDQVNDKAAWSTALLGWWGFPWGLLKTPVYIYRNFKAKKENRLDLSNRTLLSYTLANIGEVEAFKNNPDKLLEVIKAKSA